MKQLKKIFLLLTLTSLVQVALSQEVGIELVGNPQTESFGLGARVQLPVSYFTISPQFAYYPAFNKVSELYLGASIHLNIMSSNNARYYVLGNASYNSWLNYASSPLPDAQQANWGLEFGGGIQGTNCVSPFAEYRYNVKWKETNARIGVLINLGCGKQPRGATNTRYKERKAVNCPGH
jgi:hypothetical protein